MLYDITCPAVHISKQENYSKIKAYLHLVLPYLRWMEKTIKKKNKNKNKRVMPPLTLTLKLVLWPSLQNRTSKGRKHTYQALKVTWDSEQSTNSTLRKSEGMNSFSFLFFQTSNNSWKKRKWLRESKSLSPWYRETCLWKMIFLNRWVVKTTCVALLLNIQKGEKWTVFQNSTSHVWSWKLTFQPFFHKCQIWTVCS